MTSSLVLAQRLCRHCMWRASLAGKIWCNECEDLLSGRTKPAMPTPKPVARPQIARAELTARNPAQLTDRELEVLELTCKGMSSKEIARALGCEKTTIDKHRERVMFKTGCHGLAPLGVWAAKAGLV